MADDKVYHPEEMQETPFPGQEAVSGASSQASSGDVVRPATTKEVALPKKKIAHELLASSLNTKSRKILAEYSFTESGALQIGKFEQGVSGDLRITPDGIVGRDLAGIITLAFDVTTGSAIFKGEVQAADFTVIDENGLISLANFTSGNALFDGDEAFTTTSFTDITGLDLTFNMNRAAKVFISLTVQAAQEQTVPLNDMAGRIHYVVTIDGVPQVPDILIDASYDQSDGDADHLKRSTYTLTMLKQLSAGQHTIKAQYKIGTINTNVTAHLYVADLTYIVLGS